MNKYFLRFSLITILFLLVAFAAPVLASGQSQGGELSEPEMKISLKEKADRADEALTGKVAWIENRLYREDLDNFKIAQKAWEVYRKVQCDAQEKEFRGGTIAALIVSACYTSITEARVQVLGNIYALLEGIAPKVEEK